VVDLPFTGAADDEAVTVAVVDELVASGERVVLLGHSFGGTVISDAGGRPGVAHLVYLTALLLDPLVEDPPEPSAGAAAVEFTGEEAAVNPAGATGAFYHRCSRADAAWATTRLRPMPTTRFGEPPSAFAWRSVPSTYIVCTDDRMVPPDAQRWMAARAGATVELDSDHSPFLSCPGELADLLGPIVQSA
jgi:pimeloyl-ACP methyl ester carboxylesterase